MRRDNDQIELQEVLIKFSEYKTYLLKKKFLIIGCSFLFFLIGISFSFLLDDKYHAELTFVVEEESGLGSLSGMSSIANQFGFDFGGSENTTFNQNNIIQLLQSRGVITSALMQGAEINNKRELLLEHYLDINNTREDWDDEVLGISFSDKITYTHDSIIQILVIDIQNNLDVDFQSNDANIIALSYTSLDEEFAKVFADNLIDEMEKMYVSHQTAQAAYTLDFLQDRADSVFRELEIVEQQYAKVKDINQRIIKASGRLKELRLMREVEVLNTMYLEIVKNLELSKITLLQNTPIINIIDAPILPLKKTNLSFILGGFLSCLLGSLISSFYLIVRKLFKDALSKEN